MWVRCFQEAPPGDLNVQGAENSGPYCSSNMHFMSVRPLRLLLCPPDRSLLALLGAGSFSAFRSLSALNTSSHFLHRAYGYM